MEMYRIDIFCTGVKFIAILGPFSARLNGRGIEDLIAKIITYFILENKWILLRIIALNDPSIFCFVVVFFIFFEEKED